MPGNRGINFILLFVVLHAVSTVEVLVNETNLVCKPKSVSCPCSAKVRKREVLIETTSCDDDVNLCEKMDLREKCLQADSGLSKKKKRYRRGNHCKPYWNKEASLGPPNITFISSFSSVYVDDSLEIVCHVYSNPEANVYWLFNGKPTTTSRYNTNTNVNCYPTLTIVILLLYDEGTFTCVANNSLGSSNKSVYLNVKTKLKPPVVEDFGIDGEQQVAYLGGSLNLTCKVTFYRTFHIPDVWFSRHGKTVRDTKRHINLLPNVNHPPASSNTYTYKLWIKNVTLEDQGNWTCSGENNGLKDFKTFDLKTVPCPAGYCCPWRGNKKYPCRKGTNSESTANTTYKCIECPKKPSVVKCFCVTDSPSSTWFIALAVIPVSYVAVLVGIVCRYRNRVSRSRFVPLPLTDKEPALSQ